MSPSNVAVYPASTAYSAPSTTTGILTGWHHRIAEIAVVHVDAHGTVTDEWVTLVNPDRDLSFSVTVPAAAAATTDVHNAAAGALL